jgi:hypothetical protein
LALKGPHYEESFLRNADQETREEIENGGDLTKLEKKRLPVLMAEQLRQIVKACNVGDRALILFMVAYAGEKPLTKRVRRGYDKRACTGETGQGKEGPERRSRCDYQAGATGLQAYSVRS